MPPLPTRLSRRLQTFGAWAAAAAVFALLLGWRMGAETAQQFAAGYLVELSLSVDNLFVFILVFARFGIESGRQDRVLSWGILGAAVLRTVFIFAGIRAIGYAHWLVPAGGVLIFATGVKLAFSSPSSEGLGAAGNATAGFLVRRLPLGADDGSKRFFRIENGRRLATPLFAALLVLETADLIFALDSLPAVIAVTRSSFVAVSSNLFAILGLRSLYLLIQDSMRRFRFLHAGLAALLIFIGAKMLTDKWAHLSTTASLTVIGVILAAAIAASALFPERERE